MKIIEEYINNSFITEELCIALGMFDGVHRGHRKLIEQAVSISRSMNIKSAVLTFDVHPSVILKPDSNIKIITDNKTKAKIIEDLGVDFLIFLKFDETLANMDEEEFIGLLKNKFNARALVCGYNYSFAKFGHGNVDTLNYFKNIYNYKLKIVEKVKFKEHKISSSMIRHKIETGNIKEANIFLGYNYFIIGEVIRCKQLGRTLGFPTANIQITDRICLKNGVYISKTKVDEEYYPSVSSIGKNPTVGDNSRMFETHIFNFNKDIYNKEISVELLEFIRGEEKFNSLLELKNRVFKDIEVAKAYFSSNYIYKK
jgi:riboflavin kinase / FMN adenylyltransferase